MNKRNKIPLGEYKATITKLSHDGQGIAEIDGKKIFIAQALPQEEVTFEYTYVKKQYAQGKALFVKNFHAARVEPRCEAFTRCGGCSLQHMDTEAQIQLKTNTVRELFQSVAKVHPEAWLPPFVGMPWGYRKKARLGVRLVLQKGGALVGFREKFSNKIAVINACEVLDPKMGNLINALRVLMFELSIVEKIPQIEIAIGEDRYAVVLRHLIPFKSADMEKLRIFCQQHTVALYSQPSGVDSLTLLYPDKDPFLLHYTLKEQNLTFFFHPLDFTQVNPHINQQMVTEAVFQLDLHPHENVLDLFCGIGNFTLPLAQRAHKVVGVEGNESAIVRAKLNAEYNELSAQFYINDLSKPPFSNSWALDKYDKILLDPSRAGAKEIIPWIGAKNPKRIVYISCNPATLARDSGELVQRFGYVLKSIRIIDMFPQTAHVECMAVFAKD